jgi:hypothetical protein
MRKLLTLLCVVVLAAVAAGCGSSGGSDSTGGDATTTIKATTTTTTKADGGSSDGGSSDGGTADGTAAEYEAAFATALSSGSVDNGNLVLPAAGAACVAPKYVEIITVDGLHKAGITVEDASDPGFSLSDAGIDEAQAQQVIDAFETCKVDIVSLFADGLSKGLTTEQQSCIAENVDPDLTKALLVKTFSTGKADTEFEAVLKDLTATCDLPAD